jgi:hypothetical protein
LGGGGIDGANGIVETGAIDGTAAAVGSSIIAVTAKAFGSMGWLKAFRAAVYAASVSTARGLRVSGVEPIVILATA